MQGACAILSSVACPTLQYFSTFSHKRHDFRGGELLNTKCVFWFSLQLSSETFPLLRKSQGDIVNVRRSSCEALVILVGFSQSLNFRNTTQISNLRKIRPVGAESFHVDGQTYRQDEDRSRCSQNISPPSLCDVLPQPEQSSMFCCESSLTSTDTDQYSRHLSLLV